MSRPNLFHYATSELSQDAVLAWIIAWADTAHRDSNPALHDLGVRLVAALFEAAGVSAPTLPAPVRVHRPLDDLDIAAQVGDHHLLLIEDKTHTSEHGDQLVRYRKAMEVRFPKHQQARLYLKTGEQSSFEAVRRAEWTPFLRRDLLKVLRSSEPDVRNDILTDFVEHLSAIEAEVTSFCSTAPASWSGLAWSGFYQVAQEAIGGAWDYVANPSGGFMGLWWGWNSIPGGKLYLQLEQQKLTVKVAVENEPDRGRVRDAWVPRVTSEIVTPKFTRPTRLGYGQWMTVGVVEPYLVLGADGRLDVAATIDALRAATDAVKKLAKAYAPAAAPL